MRIRWTLTVSTGGTVSALAVCFGLALAFSAPAYAVCNPNGTANEVIGCIDDANAASKVRLTKFYATYLKSFDAKCQASNPGGGSGGHQDRAVCLQDMLKAEGARIGLPAN